MATDAPRMANNNDLNANLHVVSPVVLRSCGTLHQNAASENIPVGVKDSRNLWTTGARLNVSLASFDAPWIKPLQARLPDQLDGNVPVSHSLERMIRSGVKVLVER